MNGDFNDLSWSPDSRWLAYEENADNNFTRIKVLNVETGAIQALTSDRYNSMDATWSSDGKWLYFLSDRALNTTVPSPWGSREPEPHFDRPVKVYELALTPGQRSPFLPADELHPDAVKKDDDKADSKTEDAKKSEDEKTAAAKDSGDDKKMKTRRIRRTRRSPSR